MDQNMAMQAAMMNEMTRQQNEMMHLHRMMEAENRIMLQQQQEALLRQEREKEERILREIYGED